MSNQKPTSVSIYAEIEHTRLLEIYRSNDNCSVSAAISLMEELSNEDFDIIPACEAEIKVDRMRSKTSSFYLIHIVTDHGVCRDTTGEVLCSFPLFRDKIKLGLIALFNTAFKRDKDEELKEYK